MNDTDEQENLPKVLSVLDLLTEEELVELNHIVVARLRLMQQIQAHGAMMKFRLGQRVRFRSSKNQIIFGVVSRYNRKSVTLVTDAGQEWRVSPSLLEPA